MKNIVLCGFMGCGKTTLAKRLAKSFNMNFIDTDEEIARAEGKTIAEIFETDGEPYFRTLETELVKRLAKEENLVVSLGGGIAANEKNHPYLKEIGTVVLLDCGLHNTMRRILGDKRRPLAQNGAEDIKQRYYSRMPIYKAVADAIIDSSKSKSKTFKNVVKALEELK